MLSSAKKLKCDDWIFLMNNLHIREHILNFVKNLKTKKDGFKLVTGHPDVNETNYAVHRRMIHDVGDGLERTCDVKSTSEDGLLRRVYRAVDFLTQKVKNKK